MKNRTGLLFAAVLAACAAQAETVAWWRFGDLGPEGGQATATTVFTNLVNAATFPAQACSFKDQDGPGTDPNYLPSVTNAFGPYEGLQIYDPVSQTSHRTRTALHCPWGGDGSGLSGGAVVAADPVLWGVTNGVQGDFTFECFIKTTAAGINRTAKMQPIAGMPNPGGAIGGWSLVIYSGCLWSRYTWYTEKSTEYETPPVACAVTPDTWHHVAISFTASERTFRLYYDYALVKTYGYASRPDATGPLAVKTNGYLYLGKGTYMDDRSFDGEIAEARFSNRALGTADFLRFMEDNHGDRVRADPDTLSWFSMDDLAVGFGSRFLFDNAQLSVQTSSLGAGSWRTAPDVPATEVTNDVLGAAHVVRGATMGPYGLTNFVNAGSARLYSPTSSTNTCLQLAQPTALTADSFTLEFFFKTARQVVSDGRLKSSMGLCACNNFKVMINQSDGKLFCRPEFKNTSKDYGNTCGSVRVDDMAWHHLAFTYDKTARQTKLYLDSNPIAVWDDLELLTLITHPLTVGAAIAVTDVNAYQFFDGQIDEVRLTRRALAPEEFLCAGLATGRMLAHIPFDGDSMLHPYGMLGTLAPYVNGTTQVPTNIPAGRSALVMTGRDRSTCVTNAGAFRFEGGKITYPHIAAFERSNFTVEFFWRPFEKAAPWPTVLGLAAVAGNVPNSKKGIWSFYYQGSWNQTRLLAQFATTTNGVCSMTTLNVSPVYTYGSEGPGSSGTPGWKSANFDGRWHHVAATFAETVSDAGATTNTTVTTYFDYQPVVTSTRPGHLYRNGTSGLVIQPGDGSGSRLATWDLDEVRITEGVLEPREFCRPGSVGLEILIR